MADAPLNPGTEEPPFSNRSAHLTQPIEQHAYSGIVAVVLALKSCCNDFDKKPF
jgi:hypothetical protein